MQIIYFALGSGRSGGGGVEGVEGGDLIENNVLDHSLRPNSTGIVEGFLAEVVGVITKHGTLACGGFAFFLDTEQDGNILVAVEAIGDEEGNDDDVRGCYS